jgi:hypothetical protein
LLIKNQLIEAAIPLDENSLDLKRACDYRFAARNFFDSTPVAFPFANEPALF